MVFHRPMSLYSFFSILFFSSSQQIISIDLSSNMPICSLASTNFFIKSVVNFSGFPRGSVLKNLLANAGDGGSIPGSERSPGGGNGNTLKYSCQENLMDRGAWRATVHGVARVGHDLATKPSGIEDVHIYNLTMSLLYPIESLSQIHQIMCTDHSQLPYI